MFILVSLSPHAPLCWFDAHLMLFFFLHIKLLSYSYHALLTHVSSLYHVCFILVSRLSRSYQILFSCLYHAHIVCSIPFICINRHLWVFLAFFAVSGFYLCLWAFRSLYDFFLTYMAILCNCRKFLVHFEILNPARTWNRLFIPFGILASPPNWDGHENTQQRQGQGQRRPKGSCNYQGQSLSCGSWGGGDLQTFLFYTEMFRFNSNNQWVLWHIINR